ncbi:unnamed protein product [Urochloa decumbens]|uniref:Disease resistance protein At4g27190-like leucine-rich repeats domain-containing protein n=1 Tax=Urochloa decumbens TaxID=240449 RepID=A0ABC9AFC3_9POAL
MIVRYFLNNNSDNYYYERGKDIIYFDGWDGIGASAVLCAIAKLPRSKDVNFDLKIHIDFSMSGSRRALQRIIVEQLMLKENAPSLDKSVMAILDKQDEEDDFNGIENSSRAEIGDVKNHIFQFLRDKRFLVTFLNGSDEEINLVTCGFPLFDMTENKVLWTYQGRFRNRPKPASILKERQETSTYSTGAVQPAPREKLYDHVFLDKFRIIECPIQFMDLLRIPLIGMYRLEFLDLSGNKHMEVLPNLSTASGLKVLILDGCDGLRNVESHALPSSLESFSFDGFGPALKWKHLLEIPRKEARPSVRITQKTPIVSKISLNGLALLKNLFLRGLPNLLELNLSETAVQAVNLDDMQLRNLERLSLLGCEMLQRVQWHDTRNPPLKVLQIDTRAKATRSLDHDCQGFQMDNNSSPQAHIVVTDERVLRGFMITHPISNVLQGQKFHLHLSSSVSNKQGSYYNQKESSSSDELSAPQVIESPFSYLGLLSNIAGHDDNDRSVKGCALLPLQCHIEISEGGCNLEIAKDPDRQNIDMLLRYAESLHVHDHSSITTASLDCIKGQFEKTQWCLVERCPKMHTVFHIDKDGNTPQSFMSLQTFKAFQLLEVQCIWSRKVRFYEDSTNRLLAFKKLQCINLYSCPRLKFILPWSFASLPGLETILVTYCGELREIFPKGETHGRDRATSIVFSSLKRIQLEELPRLRQICETVMLAPALETVKLRGCWSLRRLPAIHTGRGNNKPLAVVDCEKDWWDMLRWDGLEESRSLFVPRHSKYYKMRMLRGSPLR